MDIPNPPPARRRAPVLLAYAAVWLIACSIGMYFRLYPWQHYTSHRAEEQASVAVVTHLRGMIDRSVKMRFAQMPPVEQQRIAQQQFDRLLKNDKNKIQRAIQKVARNIDRANPPRRNFPYLLGSDSFYYYGLTRTIARTGKLPGEIRGSKYFNPLMLAPLGFWEPLSLHPYVGYFLFKIITALHPGTGLMTAVSFTPLVVVCLGMIPFLFICYRLGCPLLPSLIGTVYLLLIPIFLKRSMLGWYDNDPYSILFPYLILLLLFVGLQNLGDRRKVAAAAVGVALATALYALFWQGWVFTEAIVLLTLLAVAVYFLLQRRPKPETGNALLFFVGVVVLSLVGIGVLFGIRGYFNLFEQGFKALRDFLDPRLSLWPNLYIGVGELNHSSLGELIGQTGGVVVWAVALWGMGVSAFQGWRRRQTQVLFPLVAIVLFLAAAFVVTLGAQRFSLLCVIPLGIAFTLGVRHVFQWIRGLLTDKAPETPFKRPVITALMVLLTGLAISWPVARAGQKIPGLLNEIYNSVWNDMMTDIRQKTPPDSIINTWWPPGHFIKAMTGRRVTFDGATINVPQAYWMANVFMARREADALGILRMLNDSGNEAAAFLQKSMPLSRAVALLKEITPLTRTEARQRLKGVLPPPKITRLLKMTHSPPPPSYLMIYNELVQDNIQFSFVGNWDFRKVEEINANRDLLSNVPSPDSKQYIPFLWKIAGGMPKYAGPFTAVLRAGSRVIFQNNIRMDLDTKECSVDSPVYGQGVPAGVFYFADGRIQEKRFPSPHLTYAVLLTGTTTSPAAVLLDPSLARTLFVRLFFFDGRGLKNFHLVSEESDRTKRTDIKLFRVDWNGFINTPVPHKSATPSS